MPLTSADICYFYCIVGLRCANPTYKNLLSSGIRPL